MMRARVVEDFPRSGHRLLLAEDQGPDMFRVLMENGDWITQPKEAVLPEGVGVRLPMGAWEAIVEIAAPMATAGEVGRLQDALDVERGRVDSVLSIITGQVTP